LTPLKPRTLLLYGRTKVGKTSNLKMLAKWFYDKYHLKIRMIHSDGGGYRPFIDSDNLIGKGIVEVFDNTNREFALQDIHRLKDGCWVDSKGELNRDPNITNKAYLQKQLEKAEVGAYFVEGTGSLSDVLLTHFSDKLTDEKSRIGFEAPWIYQEGEYAMAGLQPGHFGIVQRELHKIIVKGFGQLPVKLVVFTGKNQLGLEVTSKTKKTGEKYATATGEALYGPEGPGVALTAKIPSWFENCLYMEAVKFKTKEGKVTDGRIAWYQTHTKSVLIEGSPTEVPYLAGSSCPAERYEDMLQEFPGGYVKLGFQRGIDRYVEFLDSLEGGQ
jgi:hypothetical protein